MATTLSTCPWSGEIKGLEHQQVAVMMPMPVCTSWLLRSLRQRWGQWRTAAFVY